MGERMGSKALGSNQLSVISNRFLTEDGRDIAPRKCGVKPPQSKARKIRRRVPCGVGRSGG